MILFLGSEYSRVYGWLRARGEQVLRTTDPIDADYVTRNAPEFLISHGYRHILKESVLKHFPHRAVNLHISLLPWNRGADPNFWSFVDDTPKGVSIHFIDAGIDTGELIAQRELKFDDAGETLATSYKKLQQAMLDLFIEHWPAIRAGAIKSQSQSGSGSFHTVRDFKDCEYMLTDGWDTPVTALQEQAAIRRLTAQFAGSLTRDPLDS